MSVALEVIPGKLTWFPGQLESLGQKAVSALQLCAKDPGWAAPEDQQYGVFHYGSSNLGKAFGPLSLVQTLRFCRNLEKLLSSQQTPVVLSTANKVSDHSNAAVLVGAYLIFRQKWSLPKVRETLKSDEHRLFPCSWCPFNESWGTMEVWHCWAGSHAARKFGWVSPSCFEDDARLDLTCKSWEQVLSTYDACWLVPGLILLFADPTTTLTDPSPGTFTELWPSDVEAQCGKSPMTVMQDDGKEVKKDEDQSTMCNEFALDDQPDPHDLELMNDSGTASLFADLPDFSAPSDSSLDHHPAVNHPQPSPNESDFDQGCSSALQSQREAARMAKVLVPQQGPASRMSTLQAMCCSSLRADFALTNDEAPQGELHASCEEVVESVFATQVHFSMPAIAASKLAALPVKTVETEVPLDIRKQEESEHECGLPDATDPQDAAQDDGKLNSQHRLQSPPSECDSTGTVCKDYDDPSRYGVVSYPAEAEFEATSFFGFLQEVGVCKVVRVNFDEEEGMSMPGYDGRRLLRMGIEHLDLPMQDGSLPRASQIAKVLKLCEGLSSGERAVGFHCRGGFGRSAVLACVLAVVLFDVPGSAMLGWVRMARPGSLTNPNQEKFLCSLYGKEDVRNILSRGGRCGCTVQ